MLAASLARINITAGPSAREMLARQRHQVRAPVVRQSNVAGKRSSKSKESLLPPKGGCPCGALATGGLTYPCTITDRARQQRSLQPEADPPKA